jgi:hypothetical protein
MTLEQRVEALEKAVAKLTLPSETAEELAKVMRDVAKETIKNARRPGGVLHKLDEKAAHANAAYNVSLGINCR